MFIKCPEYVNTAFKLLEKSGFKAYAVGGCVRDVIMNKVPDDWDMTTSSSPEQTIEAFKDFKVIPTGIKHGTVTVIIDSNPIEITTMRVDGEYHDNRRPESVEFTADIIKDLSRRDFTVNAMAYNHTDGLIDPFNGKSDIKNRVIRCVGEPDIRFNEDALRIFRALRFASTLDFNIDTATAHSILSNLDLIDNIANERIRVELIKLLQGKAVERALTDYKNVIFKIIPELKPLDGFQQHNPHHIYDIWTHTVKAVANVRNTPVLRMSALLHDIGKPPKFFLDDNGIGHFHGHPAVSVDYALTILSRLRFSNAEASLICKIISIHEARPDGTRKNAARLCSKYGVEIVKETVQLMYGDISGQNPELYNQKAETLKRVELQISEIEKEKLCLKISDLNINGNDISELGFKGKEIGTVLNRLLELVLDEKIENNKTDLINTAKNYKIS